MVRVVIPPGYSWDRGDGHPVEGPWELVTDQIQLTIEPGQPKETVTSGEYVMQSDSTFYRSMEWTREETAITTPLAYSLVVVCMVQWLRRTMFPLLLLSPFALASAATYRLDIIPSATITYPPSLSGTTLKMWLFFPGSGQVTDGVSVTILESTNGKPSKFKTVSAYTASQNFYAIITNGGTPFSTRTKLKWIDPYEVGSGTEPQTNDYGNYAGEQPTDENGVPISDPTNPAPAPDIPNKAAGNFKNPFGSPATPILTIRPKDGSPPTDARFPTLNPGQEMPWNMEFPKEFDWEIGWDLGDGVVVYPGGGGNSGTSAPLPVGSPTPPSGGDGSSGAITTPPLPTPDPAPSGDVAAAVNRHAALTQAYGEAARTAAGITNNNLDKLEELFGQAVSKLGSIDGKTGNGTGMNGVTIEGDALQHLESIDGALNNTGSVAAPSVSELPMPPGFDTIGNDKKTDEINDIRGGMAGLGDAMQGVVNALGLGANYGVAPLVGGFTFLGRAVVIDLEVFSWVFDTIRTLLLFFVSVNFVWRLFHIVRGAFVG